MAAVRCAALHYEEQVMRQSQDPFKPPFLPACLSPQLCTKEQADWWEAVYKFSSGTAKENFTKLRLLIQHGLETIRLIGSHGLSAPTVIHIAQTFDKLVSQPILL